jgi:uncharacterized protein YndB with AHSA1/START domain
VVSELTDPDLMKQYWSGIHLETDWRAGSSWQLMFPDGRVADTGEIVEVDPPKRLVLKWRNEFRPEPKSEGYARCTIELEPIARAVKLTILIRSIARGQNSSKPFPAAGRASSPISNRSLKRRKLVLT